MPRCSEKARQKSRGTSYFVDSVMILKAAWFVSSRFFFFVVFFKVFFFGMLLY